MFPTKNSLPEKSRIQIVSLLQVHLSNSIDLTTYAKLAHWNVKGPDFISLHGLFDEIAEHSEEYVDLIAERIVQLGGVAEGTLAALVKRTLLPHYPLAISSGSEHVNALTQSLGYYGENIRKAASTMAELGDMDTSDIFTQVSREVDKYLWFVEAHLQAPR
jgi:starvation-inducible DNA-binding protein